MKAGSIASSLVRGEMDKTVIDPGNGPKPSDQGASVANKGKAKRSRRGKKHKRDGKPRAAAVLSHDVAADVPAGSPYVSALEPDAEPRKRKRRRRSRGKGASTQQSVSASGEQAQDPVATDATNPSSAPPGGVRKSRNRKRAHRDPRGRDPQGRPLVPSQAPRHVGKQNGRANGASPDPHRQQTDYARQAGRHHEHGQDTPADMYAALDLGTNNCRLLIAQPTRPGQFRVVDAFSRIVRLGEGLVSTGRLSDDAMDRAVEALKVCSAKLSGRPIRRMRLGVTVTATTAALLWRPTVSPVPKPQESSAARRKPGLRSRVAPRLSGVKHAPLCCLILAADLRKSPSSRSVKTGRTGSPTTSPTGPRFRSASSRSRNAMAAVM